MTRSLAALLLLAAACSREAPPAPAGPLPPPIDGETPLPSPLPEVAAKVNGQAIPLRFVEMIAKRLLEQSGNQAKDRPFAYRRATQQLVVRELLFEEAAARGLKADDARVEAAYNEARVPYPDDRAWLAFLAQQGMDADGFRRELRIQHTVAALMRAEGDLAGTQVAEKDARAYYDAHPEKFDSGERLRASHILIRVPGDAPAAQKEALRKKAEEVLAKVRKGGDFTALARQFSADTGSAGKGGDLGEFHRGQMVPPFEAAAYALEPGEVSGVVESPFGFHIIKLVERLPALKVEFEAAQEPIRQAVIEERRAKRVEALVAQLWARSRIETNL
ncbi:MAG TPA: peptidylprolyl isomerase [Vicinamibacteria bacterium]|nr:peptidylprolyl isomerase [Vicinamibacteria bacterium]